MRILSFILAILFFGISALPCADSEAEVQQMSETHIHISDTESDHSHSGNENHKDGCSPFCICSCCGMAITIPPVVDSECTPFFATIDHRTIWLTDNSFAHLTAVWQPPASC
ncbi:MAG: hypothetical protein HKN39_02240 [Flavobacteriales bacterium]|nr:hypothetical protein [Flavobacteriales bacterium]